MTAEKEEIKIGGSMVEINALNVMAKGFTNNKAENFANP